MKLSAGLLLSVFPKVVPVLLTAALFLTLSASQATGDDDLRTLELYNGAEAEIITGNRSPRPASQTAENITVVTADEIKAMNAHTLADILYCITGVQLEMNRTPGTVTNFEIQGSNFNHVLVLIDNVPINNLADNFADISSVTVQMIERVEVVKGAASASWGSALGGGVNVITKSPQAERAFGVSASMGKRETADVRAEMSDTIGRTGYYLTGGKLRSDGLLPNNMSDLDSFYGKFSYELPGRGSLTFTAGLTDGPSGQLSVQNLDIDQDNRQLVSTLSLQYPLAHRFTVDASLRTRRSSSKVFFKAASGGSAVRALFGDDTANGASLKISWLGKTQRVVAGADYDHVKLNLKLSQAQLQLSDLSRADRFGIYLIDTIAVGAFAVTPSIRFDHTGSGGDHFSPSFGITYALTENSLLRGYTTKGYSLTSLNRSGSTERVWTSQLGFETGDVPYLWLKGTLFRNDTRDVRVNLPGVSMDQRQVKQGVELELRTLPLLYTSLSAGYTLMSAKSVNSGPELKGAPRHTVNIGVRYRDPGKLHAELTGHYIDWNSPATGAAGNVIWDLHLSKKVEYSENGALELFLSIRNLLDGNLYLNRSFENPGRWAEGGIRCNF